MGALMMAVRESIVTLAVLIVLTVLLTTGFTHLLEEVLAFSPLVLIGIAILGFIVFMRYRGAVGNISTSTIIVIAVVVLVLGFMGVGSGEATASGIGGNMGTGLA